MHRKPALLTALNKEIDRLQLPGGVVAERKIDTVYFGGGTPSLLDPTEVSGILNTLKRKFDLAKTAEITLEANPDDITDEKLAAWKLAGINRLSIGIQSFFDADLTWMNRAHSAAQAIRCIELAHATGFHNLTIDLIYGTPTLTDENWKKNVETALSLGVNHLSCYALTVEDNTALSHFIKKGKVPPVAEEKQERHFNLLMEWMETAGFDQYEISNFSKPGYFSRHNSNYWSGNPYYGFGPAAHSFDGKNTRWWNMANNGLYIDALMQNQTAFEFEILSGTQRLNERIMTALRTSDGLKCSREKNEIAGVTVPAAAVDKLMKRLENYQRQGMLTFENERVILTRQGKLFADGIAAKLFID